MITARNYAAEAEKQFTNYQVSNFVNDADYQANLKEILNTLNHGVHFALPDNGVIFNDNFKGMTNVPVKLPFERITIEFFTTNHYDKNISKIIIVAEQKLDEIIAHMLMFEKNKKVWVTSPCAFLTKSQVFDESFVFQTFDLSKDFSILARSVKLRCGKTIATHLCELLEALSCKNVYTQALEPFNHKKKNDKLVKAGKLPLYETKILVVDSSVKIVDKTDLGGTHASPRQHLRRGHIRRYATYSIWINNMVIGKASNGKIDKSYAVK